MSTPTSPQTLQLQAELRVAPDHPCFAGHFPGRPMVPAVLLLDLICADLLAILQIQPGSPHQQWRLARIIAARFQSPWLPNEPLVAQMQVNLSTLRTQIQAFVGERAVATATIQLAPAADSGSSRS